MRQPKIQRTKEESKKSYLQFITWIAIQRDKQFKGIEFRKKCSELHIGITTYYHLKIINLLIEDKNTGFYKLNRDAYNKYSFDEIYKKIKESEKIRNAEYRKKRDENNKQTEKDHSNLFSNSYIEVIEKLNKIMKFMNIE